MTKTNVEAFRQARDAAAEKLENLKIIAAEKSALNATAVKAEKVDAAMEAARAKAAVAAASRALKDAEKSFAAAERAADQESKDSELAADMAERQEAMQRRLEMAKTDPFMAYKIDWVGLGRWLADRAEGRACFVEGAGWGEWQGSHWSFSRKPAPSLLDRVRALYANKTGKIAQQLLSNPRAALYMLEHAQGALTVPRSLFNSSAVAHLVAFQNVTVDLRTGATMEHDPEHYMTGAMQCDFDANADVDRIETAFRRFWPNDPETAAMFQTAIGYSATGEVSAKRVFFMVGNQEDSNSNGDNGKSLVQNALTQLFGQGRGGWGTAVKPGIIVDTGDRDANSHDGAKTPLIWRRFAMSSEPRKGSTIESGEFNRISGGDWQSARPPHGEESVQFINFASLWVSMNTVIRFKAWDKATRIRLTPFPFTETFYDPGTAPDGCQEKEIGLKEFLESEDGMKAMGLYVVRGSIAFYAANAGKAGNIEDSAAVAKLRDDILMRANPFHEFFEENFVFDEAVDVARPAISRLLADHLNRRPKLAEKTMFEDALAGNGAKVVKIRGDYYWRGVSLTEAARKHLASFGIQRPEFVRSPAPKSTVVNIS